MKLTFEKLFELEGKHEDAMMFIITKSTRTDLYKLLKDNGITGYSKSNKSTLVQVVVSEVKKMITEKIESVFNAPNEPLKLDIPEEMKPIQTPVKASGLAGRYMSYFSGIWNEKQLKHRHSILSKMLHPDRVEGKEKEFEEMQHEYRMRIKMIHTDIQYAIRNKEECEDIRMFTMENWGIDKEYMDYWTKDKRDELSDNPKYRIYKKQKKKGRK